MSYTEALSILIRVRAGDLTPTFAQITQALVLTGDLDA
jgi:hypothetical protein